jgi:hypothetical protein
MHASINEDTCTFMPVIALFFACAVVSLIYACVNAHVCALKTKHASNLEPSGHAFLSLEKQALTFRASIKSFSSVKGEPGAPTGFTRWQRQYSAQSCRTSGTHQEDSMEYKKIRVLLTVGQIRPRTCG